MRCSVRKIMVTKIDWLLAGCVAVLVNSIGLGSFALAENAEFDLQLEYRVSWSNADIASATANWSFGDTRFELVATSRTLGMIETFRKYRGKVEISGRIENGWHAPKKLYLSGISKRRTREATTNWDGATGAISTTRTPELDLEKVFPLEDRHIEGAIDPLSAMLNALANLSRVGTCSGTERVYDGLRTSEITLHDLGTAMVKKDRPFSFEGEARVCGFTGTPTGGHQRKSQWRDKERKPEDLRVFVAEVQPDLFVPVRMEAKSFLGTVTSRLVMPSLRYNRRDG